MRAVRIIPSSRGRRRRRAARPSAGWANGGWCDLRQCWWIEASLVLRTTSTLNAREDWRTRAARTEQERLSAAAAIMGRLERRATPPLEEFQTALAGSGPVHLVARLVRIAPRALDPGDNLSASLKAVRDGVADALGLPNDRDPRVAWTYDQDRFGPREYAVLIELQLYAGAKALEMRAGRPAQEVEDGQRNEGTKAGDAGARGTHAPAAQGETAGRRSIRPKSQRAGRAG